ncbi:BQ2448_1990 [Microbotryum intermedium]|uniref:BQ2448_1990 protein n=1 Tax=Microbotryum intermedium TaxID=269621 RepID=A0A238F4T4_9BASI|nr:BQ2448_1990 [Microbotryum intermedium]
MDADPDPALAFWPNTLLDSIDLYATLKIARTATESEIKSSYRRQALLSHPDKLSAQATVSQIEASQLKFQQISYAYNVLKDEKRRKRYDETGRTDEGAGLGRSEDEWREYFKELWTGQVNAQTMDQFKKEYQGSEEELSDLYEAYDIHSGDLESISNHIMCSTIQDEPRFIALINQAIQQGQLKPCKKWTTSSKNVRARSTRIKKATQEANEAEAYAKELGVHDQLYNTSSASVAAGKGNKEGGVKGKGKAKGNSKTEEEVDGDLDGLKALIQGRQANRMESLMESLEAKYGAGVGKKNKGNKRSAKEDAEDEDEGEHKKKRGKKKVAEEEMSEEDFLKARAAIDARAAKAKSKNK